MKSHLVVTVVLLLSSHSTVGQKCEIPTDDKYVNCVIFGGYNVKTFQGEFFSFNSSCQYTVVDFKKDGEPIRVNIAKSVIHVVVAGKKYELKLSATKEVVFVTEAKTYSTPAKIDDIEVVKPGRFVVAKFASVGLNIKWDGANFIVVEIDNSRNYELSGLCSKDCDEAVPTFIEQWKSLDACEAQEVEPCDPVKKRPSALQYCRALISNKKYNNCINKANINSFLNQCQLSYCNCKSGVYHNCMCNLVDSFIKHCEARTGKSVNWRGKGFCEEKCRIPHQRYMECGGRQKACGEPPFATTESECIEGCACPLNLWYTDERCVIEEHCPCRYEDATYPPGTSVVQDCRTCVCTYNNKWSCPPTMCYGDADVIGDPHYTTFDGKRFDFMGKCTYYLVKGVDFSITADHYVLENGKFLKNFKSNAPSWTKVVEITTGDDVITLKPNLVVTFNGKEIKRFPHKESNITINKPTSSKLIVDLPNYVEVHWDGSSAAKVRMPTTMRGYIQGLMGNFNKNPKDDFMLPDGTVVNDANTFGHSWKVEGSCEDENTNVIPHPCEDVPLHRSVAEKACSALKGDLFKGCKEYNAQESYESCVYDCCHAVKLGEKCACETIAAHAARCGNATTEWRKQVPVCEEKCPAGQEYNYCISPCESSCDYIALNPKCQKQCLEGCGCPAGQTFDENKKCVPIEKCKCMLNGKYFPVNYKFLSDKNLKTCVKGKWEESPESDADKKKYDSFDDLASKCAKKPNSEYTACKIRTPITCKNMDSYKEETIDNCQEGCECVNGFVLNTENDNCVKQEGCPCFFNGKSYDDSAERKTISGKCICKSSKWECTKHKNAIDKCSIFGDINIRNLDGKLISFESSCEYTLAKGQFNNKPFIITTKSGDVSIAYTDDNNKRTEITLNKDGVVSPKTEELIDLDTTKVLELENVGIKFVWNEPGLLHFEFKPEAADKVEGLCGILENPDIITDKDNLISIIDSWNNDPTCFQFSIPTNKDVFDLEGEPIATKCDALKSETFESCTKQLPADEYYNLCTLTAQNSIPKGDTGSLERFYCQVLSAFAQECKDVGNPIEWRSAQLCPIKCDDKKVHSQCVSTCSCEDIEKSGKCPDRPCTEGCVSVQCPKENIYTNKTYSECTTIEQCPQIKCLNNLRNYDDNCKCEEAQVVCTTTTAPPTSTTTVSPQEETAEEIPVIEPEGRSNAQEELVDAFYDVKASLEHINDPSIYDTLTPKDKQMIETFTNHVEEFEDEINCYANIVDSSKCKCFNGEQICGLKKTEHNQRQNDHDVQNNLELIKFMQSHLKCLENLKENPQNCSCISGKRICPEKPVTVSTTAKSAPVIYYYIIKCERGMVVSFYNLHFAKEGLNCLSQLNKDPSKNCRCEKGQMICSLQPKQESNARKPKEISKDAYTDYINDMKKQLQCQAKIANRQETCRCEKGREICSKEPEPVPEENSYEVVKKYMDSPVNKSQIYDTFEKGLECTEELGDETKVCTCLNGEKECFDMDFESSTKAPPPEDVNPAKNVLPKVEDTKSQIVCLMRRDSSPQCAKYHLADVNPSSDDILQLNVYLQYLRHINDQLTCLRDKPSYCVCAMGRQQCSFDQPNIPNQKQKEKDQVNAYNTFLDHINNQMKCLSGLKGKRKNCFCDNGQEKCEKAKNYVMYPLLDNNVLGEYDKEKLFPYIEKQLHCYETMKTISNKCSCKDGVVDCEKPAIVTEPEVDDDFSKMRRHIPDQLKEVNKIDHKLRCFISGGRRRNCDKILPQRTIQPQVPLVSDSDKQLLRVYGNYFRHIKVQLTCFGDIVNSNCMCSDGKLVCGANLANMDTYRYKAANAVYGYGYFVHYVGSQLNCLQSLNDGDNKQFCSCGSSQECGSEPKANKLIRLMDVKIPMYRDPNVLYSHIDSQLKCLSEMEDKSGVCYCSNGQEVCGATQPLRKCPPVNCPTNTRIVRECQECCPKCEGEHCLVDITSGGVVHQQVKKVLGETWLEDNCRECRCTKDQLGIYASCTQQQCPAIPESELGTYQYVKQPGKCCPKIVPMTCEDNGRIYPVNTVISRSACETLSCARNHNGEVIKQIHRVTCNTTCPRGYAYRPVSGQCCGECYALGCLYNNEIKQYGEVWFSENKCYRVRCLKRNNGWVVSKTPKACPPLGPCNGVIRVRDCCGYCDITV